MNPVEITTRPIVTWPGAMTRAHDRQRPRYSASPTATRRELLREMELIGACDVFIQAAYRDDQIRLDGLPRSGAVPAHPGIILTYTTKGGTYQLPCDTFASVEQNLRAIVLTLQRLRLIEETGVRTHGRQYEGFKALPSDPEAMTVDQAARWMIAQDCGASLPHDLIGIPANVTIAYRELAKRMHPDVGGDVELFKMLGRAKRVLDEHHAGGAR